MRTQESVANPGYQTFMHMPFVLPEKNSLKEAEAGIAILGAPLETGTGGVIPAGGIPGSSVGPRTIRLGSEWLITYNVEFDIDMNDYFKIVDCGDVSPAISNVKETHNRIESALSEILGASAFPIVLGGDHSITIPCINAFHQYFKGKIGMIHFDSHLDTWDAVGGFRYGDCSPIARALELERVSGKNIAQIGIRGDINDAQARKAAKRANITTFYRNIVFDRGISDVTKEAVEIASNGTEAVYLTLDVDCLDGAYVSATSVPAAGGLSTIEIIKSLRIITKAGIVKSFDLVEVGNAAADPNNITGRTAATLIAEFIAGMAVGKRGL